MVSSISNASAGMPVMKEPPSQEEVFKKVDANGDGTFDKTELSEFAKMISQMSGQDIDVDEIMSLYDEDGDGILQEQEAYAALDGIKEKIGSPPGPPPGPPPDAQAAASSEEEEDEEETTTISAQAVAEGISLYEEYSKEELMELLLSVKA